MPVVIESTTDSPEQVQAALGGATKKESVTEEKSASAHEADETSEASDASNKDLESGDEADAQEDSDDSDDENKDEDRPKKKKGFKKRIDKLSKRASEAEERAKYWEEQAKKSAPAVADQPKEASKTVEMTADNRPQPENFDSNAEYVEALTDWKIEQRERAKEAKAKEESVKTEYSKALEAHNARLAEFQKSHSDYNDVVKEFVEEHGDVRFSAALEESVITSENGPALLYELAKHPEEFMKINSLGYAAALRAIGAIEANLSKSSESPKENEKKQTKAPPPLNPVGSRGSGKSAKSPDDMSFDEFKRWRAEQRN